MSRAHQPIGAKMSKRKRTHPKAKAKAKTRAARNLRPGEILKEEFLVPLRISANRLATSIGVPSNRIYEIVNGERAITAETAVLFGKAFKTTPEFWINLQTHYELRLIKNSMTAHRRRKTKRLSAKDGFGREFLKLQGTVDPDIDLEF